MHTRYLSTAAAARYLDLHPETVRQKAQAGQIQARKTDGGYWRFKQEWLDEYLEQGTEEEAAHGA